MHTGTYLTPVHREGLFSNPNSWQPAGGAGQMEHSDSHDMADGETAGTARNEASQDEDDVAYAETATQQPNSSASAGAQEPICSGMWGDPGCPDEV